MYNFICRGYNGITPKLGVGKITGAKLYGVTSYWDCAKICIMCVA